LAYKLDELADTKAPLANEPALVALPSAVLAAVNAPLAKDAAEFAVAYADGTNDEKSFAEFKPDGSIVVSAMIYL